FAECYVHDVATGKEVRQWQVDGGFGNEVGPAALSPDGKTLAIAVGEDGRLYDVGAGKEARRLRSVYREVANCFLSLAFTPDSKGLAVSETGAKLNYTPLTVSAVADGKCSLRRKETDHFFVHLAYSPDGKDLATAERRHVVILDAATLK